MPATRESLVGRTFLSTAVTEVVNPTPPDRGTGIRIDFRDEGFGFSAGCNTISSTWAIEEGRLVSGRLDMTAISCSDGENERDQRMLTFVGSRPVATLAGERLTLATDTTKIDLLDRRTADPDRPLIGRVWRIGTIANHGYASPGNDKATLRFADDGHVAIDTGCNTGSAEYSIAGPKMHFSNVAVTKRGCVEADKSTEDTILAVVRAGSVAYRIEANQLSLDTAPATGPAIWLMTE